MKKFLRTMNHLGPAAYTILKGTLLVACALTASSFLLHAFSGLSGQNTYLLRNTADTLWRMAPGLLLISTVIASLAESLMEEKTQ